LRIVNVQPHADNGKISGRLDLLAAVGNWASAMSIVAKTDVEMGGTGLGIGKKIESFFFFF
jgi:hypothetical protein